MPRASGFREHALLFGRFLRSPRTVGTVVPSSRALADAMVEGLDLAAAARVVELGPGTGALTGAVIAHLGPATKLLAVEIEPLFVEQLHARWPDLDCVCASAETLEALVAARGWPWIDHVVSGLPFVSLPPAVTRRILEALAAVLRPGGTFTTFQYLHGYSFSSAVAFRETASTLLGGSPRATFVVRNVPPAFVLTWTKSA